MFNYYRAEIGKCVVTKQSKVIEYSRVFRFFKMNMPWNENRIIDSILSQVMTSLASNNCMFSRGNVNYRSTKHYNGTENKFWYKRRERFDNF